MSAFDLPGRAASTASTVLINWQQSHPRILSTIEPGSKYVETTYSTQHLTQAKHMVYTPSNI